MKANASLKLKSIKHDNKANMAVALGGMIALLVAIIIGVLVFYEINDNISFDSADSNAGHVSYRASRNSSNDTAETVFTLLPIIAIVLIASIILAVVSGFGGGKGGM